MPGRGSWKISRFITSTSSTSQNTSPAEKKIHDVSGKPSGTPATGATTLPTAGMNHAGEMWMGWNGRCPIQFDRTASVRPPCAAAPTIQSTRAASGATALTAVAISRSEIEIAGKNASFTGWRHSARTACG